MKGTTGLQIAPMSLNPHSPEINRSVFPLFFCDLQEENAEIAPFFVHFTKK